MSLVVRDACAQPSLRDGRVTVQTPDSHQRRDAIEPVAIVEAGFHEVIERIGSVGSPVPMHFDDECTRARVEAGLESIRSSLRECGRIGQRWLARRTLRRARGWGACADCQTKHGGDCHDAWNHDCAKLHCGPPGCCDVGFGFFLYNLPYTKSSANGMH